ncbi:MAG: hypothetical protein K6T30_08805 [Alicyclobacillus sp.]|nr:hypothetical protein [Alicyclobacillus sp.]
MGKGRSTSGGGRRTLLIPDRPAMPDVCWVKMPDVKNADSVAVSLESLASQLHKQPRTRPVRRVSLTDNEVLRVEFAEAEMNRDIGEGSVAK